MSYQRVTTYHDYSDGGALPRDNQYSITTARTPCKMVRRVKFDSTPSAFRQPAHEDELYVMQNFAGHASHCSRCKDPSRLCKRGHAYARDVAQYVYSEAGKADSVVNNDTTDARVQIEIPVCCDAIRGLPKAVDQGLKIGSRKLSPVVSYGQAQRRRPEWRDGDDVSELAPRRREERW
jgi:hypothetical protein